MTKSDGAILWRVGAVVLLASVVGGIGRPAAAQRSIRVSCVAPVRGQPIACIRAPREGVTLAGPNVRVVLTADGVPIAAVAQGKAGAAHYHIFLDVDLPSLSEAIPQGPGITHLGSGQKEFVLEGVPLGMHRLIVILGDNAHVPVPRQKGDTTYFSVAMP
jgi:hypothetical protein